MSMHLLVAINNFWVGGRETYIATYLKELKHSGFNASLIASSCFQDTPEASIFDKKWICGTGCYAERWRNWVRQAHDLVKTDRPSLIWAHHFDLLPAWLISRLYRVPLLTTFHGPLTGSQRPNDPMQALGMTLAVHRGNAISGVSEEIVAGIASLNRRMKTMHLIPNSVEIEDTIRRSSVSKLPRRFVLITRPEKLGHTRKAVLLFDAYRKKVKRCSLIIAGGTTPEERGENERQRPLNVSSKAKLAVKYLGGKWCYEQGTSFLRSLSHIHFNGYTANPRKLIRKSDVVLGMGRVLLEGLAEGKPCILIGYDEICGLVTAETFEQYRWSNFSGRGVQPQTVSKVCKSILDHCGNGKTQNNEHLHLISVSTWVNRLKELIEEVIRFSEFRDDEIKLAKELSQDIEFHQLKSEDIYARVCQNLSSNELSSLYLISKG